MRAVKPFSTENPTNKQLARKVNQLVEQRENDKEEIRQLKKLLRKLGHFPRV